MKVLYYSMVDWKWIKQRPHFITAYLNRAGIETHYAYPVIIGRSYFKKTGFVRNIDPDDIRKIPIKQLPKENVISIIHLFNRAWRKRQINRIIHHEQYEIVVLTHPSMYPNLPDHRPFKLVYEMMDDYLKIGNVRDDTAHLKNESMLCDAANHIVTSSQRLKDILIERHSVPDNKIVVIPNAYDRESFMAAPSFAGQMDEKSKMKQLLTFFNQENFLYQRSLLYIGTISHWLDVDTLTKYAAQHPEEVILLVGPVENVSGNEIERLQSFKNIILTGSVEHQYVGTLIQLGSIMILPFRVTALIESVDPVKLYEYTYFHKPIVSSYWHELDKFAPFVSFYNDQDIGSFTRAVETATRKIIDDAQLTEFNQTNDWHSRIQSYLSLLSFGMVK